MEMLRELDEAVATDELLPSQVFATSRYLFTIPRQETKAANKKHDWAIVGGPLVLLDHIA